MKPRPILLIFSICLIFLTYHSSSQTTINLPVSQLLLYKINLSIRRLQILLNTLGTPQQNRRQIWLRTQLTKRYFTQVHMQLNQKYNTITIGSGNKAQSGNRNIIIGNYNNIRGKDNWVLTSNYQGQLTGNLLLNQWRVQLNKTQYILVNPSMAVSFISDINNRQFVNTFLNKNRQFCQWGQWVQHSQQSANLWRNYVGFEQWRSPYERQLYSWIQQQWDTSDNKQNQFNSFVNGKNFNQFGGFNNNNNQQFFGQNNFINNNQPQFIQSRQMNQYNNPNIIQNNNLRNNFAPQQQFIYSGLNNNFIEGGNSFYNQPQFQQINSKLYF